MRLYVMAANYQHFLHYCRQQGMNPHSGNVLYVSSPQVLMGLNPNDCEFYYYETWIEHPQWWEINYQVEMLKALARPVEEKVVEPKNSNFWYRLTKLEPSVYRGLIVAGVALLASVGVAISPGVPDALVGFIWALSALTQALWTRSAVTANARVAVEVPDPINAPDEVVPGEAVTTASNADILSAAKS